MSNLNETKNSPDEVDVAHIMPKHYHPRVVLKLVLLGLLLVAVAVGVTMGITTRRNSSDSELASSFSTTTTIESPQQQMVDEILPFLQVTIDDEGNDKVQGSMEVIEDRELFAFASERGSYGDVSTISFLCDPDKATNTNEMDGWCGFEMKIVQDTSIDITLVRYDGQDDTVISIANDQEDGILAQEEQIVMESFLTSKLSEYFVGLTFKLGAMGKSGASSEAYGILHAHAQWIVSVAIHDENIEVHWDLGTSFDSSGERRRLGIHETSVVAQINSLYIGDSTMENIDEDLPPFMVPEHRKLGSCGAPRPRCGNDCFGMCGPDCTCWAWACGDCQCYDGCRLHDYYCSCVSFWSFPCLFAIWALVC
jgi:hypothetical protein